MPSYNNAEELAQRIKNCNKKLDNLFEELKKDYEFYRQLQEIKFFYARSFNKVGNIKSRKSIVKHYEALIHTLSKVKSGQISAKEGFERIQETTEKRQFDIVIQNILKVCELLFWTAAAVTAYVALVTVGIPMLCVSPMLAIAINTSSALLFIASLSYAAKCFEKFESFNPINDEHAREKNAVSFFSTSSNQVQKKETTNQNDHSMNPKLSLT